MKKTLASAFVLLLMSYQTIGAATDTHAALATRIDALFGNLVGGDSPGFAVLVSEDGNVLFQEGYGFADIQRRRPVSPQTKFRIGSITKQFTAVAIARLTLGDSLPEERPPQIDAGVPLSTLDEVVGRYDMGNNLVLTIARDGSRLFGAVTGRARMELFPKSERSFFVGKGEAEATFVKGPHGEIVKAILMQAGGRTDAWKMPASREAP